LRIETDRLMLRSAEAKDAESLTRLFNDPEVLRFFPPRPPWTIELGEQAIERRRAIERDRGHAAWIIELRDTQEFIGNGGIQPVAARGTSSWRTTSCRRPGGGASPRKPPLQFSSMDCPTCVSRRSCP
jgi:RimJ/RimL family protein N-acetyltransferase